MPFCDACGAANRAGALFCSACGNRFRCVEASPDSDVTLARGEAPPPDDVPAALKRALSGTYEVRRLLGRGGMGVVYLAREIALDRLVALKVILDEKAGKETVERFLSEARLAARLHHPNIVSIHAVSQQAGVDFFTMDFVDGTTLGEHVERAGGSGLPATDARRVISEICGAVGHAHRMGVLHRDLKPGNVMVDAEGRVVVMDFGLAKAMDASSATAPNVLLGTPAYLSPEQLEGHPASPRSDVYAVGLIAYFVLTGRRLVQGESMTSVVAQHVSGAPAMRLLADERVPADLRSLLAAMVQKDPEKRPASLSEVAARLRGPAHEELPTTPVRPTSPPKETPSPAAARRTPSSDAARRLAREKMKALLDALGKKDG